MVSFPEFNVVKKNVFPRQSNQLNDSGNGGNSGYLLKIRQNVFIVIFFLIVVVFAVPTCRHVDVRVGLW